MTTTMRPMGSLVVGVRGPSLLEVLELDGASDGDRERVEGALDQAFLCSPLDELDELDEAEDCALMMPGGSPGGKRVLPVVAVRPEAHTVSDIRGVRRTSYLHA